jgi:hypothetical protein
MNHVSSGNPQTRTLLLALPLTVGWLFFGTARADEKRLSKTSHEIEQQQKQARADQKNKLYSVTYDVADLVHNPTPWASDSKGHVVKEIVGTIFVGLRPEIWEGTTESGNALKILNGTKIEIVANAEQHGQIVELLTAFRRLADCGVMMECQLFEVNQTFFKNEIEPKLAKDQAGLGKLGMSPIEEKLASKLRKQGTLIASNKKLIPNKKQSDFFSLHRAFTYLAKPKSVKNAFATALYGITIGGKLTVSSDRRRIAMRIRQEATNMQGLKKEMWLDPETGEYSDIEVPNLVESSTCQTIEIEDEKFVLQLVHCQFPTAKKKDGILVMLMHPSIYIQEEEDFRKKGKQ